MQVRLTIVLAAALAMLVGQQAAAQTQRPRPPPSSYPDRTFRELGRPKYPPTRHGDLSIRRENDSMRSRLLGQEPIGSSLRR